MIEALRTAEDKTPKDVLEAVTAAVDEFVGNAPQFDDLTMLCIEYKGTKED
jgi:serine phosphatase RsbU (regulator of sigma subunit)